MRQRAYQAACFRFLLHRCQRDVMLTIIFILFFNRLFLKDDTALRYELSADQNESSFSLVREHFRLHRQLPSR